MPLDDPATDPASVCPVCSKKLHRSIIRRIKHLAKCGRLTYTPNGAKCNCGYTASYWRVVHHVLHDHDVCTVNTLKTF